MGLMDSKPTLRQWFFGDGRWGDIARDAWRTLRGSPHQQPSRWGVSSVRIFKPRITARTWLRLPRPDGRVPVYNLFNRYPAPSDRGYSVRVTHCRDFLGGQHTYDGHLGTDFACPIGTPIVTPAPGLVLRVATDIGYGGLKVCIDHGRGLFSTANHLSRATVQVGQTVGRGDVVGLSGASGLEFVLCFPWVAPHLHFNTWLDGEAVDPYAAAGEIPLWRHGNDPVPWHGEPVAGDADVRPSRWSAAGVEAAIVACRDPVLRARALARGDLAHRAAEILVIRSYGASAFDGFPPLYESRHHRLPWLDLPFRAQDYRGAALPTS
jgi:murein DD-endopeptidase MepM/ murein hydrolase activator NlpD